MHNNLYLCWLEPNFLKSDNRIRTMKKKKKSPTANTTPPPIWDIFKLESQRYLVCISFILLPKGRFREDLLDSSNLYFKLDELKRGKKITFLQILYRSMCFHLIEKWFFKIFLIVTLYEILTILKSKISNIKAWNAKFTRKKKHLSRNYKKFINQNFKK